MRETSQRRDEIEDEIEEETKDDRGPNRRNMMLKAVSLSARAATAANLSNALKGLIGLDRQAHGMVDRSEGRAASSEVCQEMTDEELAAIAGSRSARTSDQA